MPLSPLSSVVCRLIRQTRWYHQRLLSSSQSRHVQRRGQCEETTAAAALVRQHTVLTRDHMVPDLALFLITKQCPLWDSKGDNSPFTDPFWAFFWPGGQVLTRYILDNPSVFRDQTVLDVGSGCGASAIACATVGAKLVIANDVDPVAIEAVKLNAEANQVSITTNSSDLIGQLNSEWTTILLGDMFYDEEFRDSIVSWVTEHCRIFKSNIFIGDPGRLPLVDHPIKDKLTKVAEYELSEECKAENNGLSTGYVWKLDSGVT